MQLICLNAWVGRAFNAMADFILCHRETTDVFCFQEVYAGGAPCEPTPDGADRDALHNDLRGLLPDFVDIFTPMERQMSPWPGPQEFGLSTFVRRSVDVCESGLMPLVALGHEPPVVAPGWEGEGTWPLQFCRLPINGRGVVVANFYGNPEPVDKLDTQERIEHSRGIIDYLANGPADVILVGDFNLLPETESIAIVERRFRNLVLEYAIPTTRSRLNPYHGTPQEQKFADYVFVSAGIEVRDFRVPDIMVSDHLPLILEFG